MSLGADELGRVAAKLRVDRLRKVYGEGEGAVEAIGSLGFTVGEGEFVSVVGPSGCGKTTLLKCIAGLLPATAGDVHLDGQLVVEPPEKVAFIFQDYSRSLFPWMSVAANVGFPLRRKGIGRAERRRQAEEALEAVDLRGIGARYPWQLSGGMQQRVAIARALAYKPELLLMDEPFASVDAQTRADLEDMALQVRRAYGVTIVLVTHDIDEAVYLGDRVIVLGSPPSTVVRELEVDLPEPRDQVTTKNDRAFAELRTEVWGAIRRSKAGGGSAGASRDGARPAGADTVQVLPGRGQADRWEQGRAGTGRRATDGDA